MRRYISELAEISDATPYFVHDSRLTNSVED
jgi:hypothetical protein